MVTDANRNMVALLAMIVQAAEHVGNPRLRKDLRITNEKAVIEAIELMQETNVQMRRGEDTYVGRIENLVTTEKLLRAELKLANDRIAVYENREEEEIPGPMVNIEGRLFATFTTSASSFEFIIRDPRSSLTGRGMTFRAALLDLFDEVIDLYDSFRHMERFYPYDTDFAELLRWVKTVRPTISIPQIPDPFNDEDEDIAL